jgi:hypothetical protein
MKKEMEKVENNKSSKYKLWFKRLGFAGFMFFLIKGLLWLVFLFGFKECFLK